jgi:single-strand DNA-binding protein
MFNQVTLIGNLGGAPETKQVGENVVATFSLATVSGYGDKSKTEWHNITVWGKTAESCAKFLEKGSQAMIQGRIEYQTYDKPDGSKGYATKIVANEVKFLSKREKSPFEEIAEQVRPKIKKKAEEIDTTDIPW